jgi:hypothetical protein
MSSGDLWSPLICLAERNRSSFALVVFCVQVRNCFLLLVMPTTVVSGNFKPMRVGLHTRILRLRAPMDGILFRARRMFWPLRVITSTNSYLSSEA